MGDGGGGVAAGDKCVYVGIVAWEYERGSMDVPEDDAEDRCPRHGFSTVSTRSWAI